MRTSSERLSDSREWESQTDQASQQTSAAAPLERNARADGSPERNGRADGSIAPLTALNVPEFSARGPAYAVTARLAGRVNAASVTESEYESLLSERQILLDKLFSSTISRREQNRLEYVRWSLDRIEDAKHGAALDKLESFVSMYENFAAQVDDLRGQLEKLTKKRK